MTENHPITPPEEVIDEWESEWHHHQGKDTYEMFMAKQAAQWGADEELEECLSYAGDQGLSTSQMRNHRRPKPPSLKEQAIAVLDDAELDSAHYNIILRALESLPD